MIVSKHTRELLQYDAVIRMIAGLCVTAEGQEKARQLLPETDSEKFSELDAVKELAHTILDLQQNLNAPIITYFPPICEYLQDEKSFLELEEIYAIGLFTKSVSELKSWSTKFQEKNELSNSLNRYIDAMPDLSEQEQTIFAFIDKDGTIQNIPSLKKLEREIISHEETLQKFLRRYFVDERYSAMLQSNVPTIRDGRQVIAVKANFKGRIAGIIHEYSQSGQTFYIEPTEIVEKNNDILEAQSRYQAELKRILNEVSEKIFAHRSEIRTALDLLAKLDLIFASVKLAQEKSWHFLNSAVHDTAEADGNDGDASSHESTQAGSSRFFLKQARHPLLKNPVPINVLLQEKTRVLIITGANAGGKTVTLKTVCLFALLNQAGLPVPCEAGSKLPYFDFIACDIGDEQSIDLSLSTFSSHMKNVAYILEHATENSLIALDELGSGTEPQEGSAIAVAILDALIQKRAFVFVSTHHGALKNYGYTQENCENASVEFDTESLQATYKIVMGVPGESHAFEIAAKSGLDKRIIQNAKNVLGENRADVSQLIKDLIEKNKQAHALIEAAKEKELAANEKIRRVDLKSLQLKQKELQLREQGYRRLENFFLEKRKELENLIRSIREGELDREKILSTKDWLDGFEHNLQSEAQEIEKEKSALRDDADDKKTTTSMFQEGDPVFSSDYNRSGVILRKEKNNMYRVELGNLKLTVPGESLVAAEKPELQVSVGVELTKHEQPVFELRLLGMRESEAKKALTNQLDLAVVSNLKSFSIVHGKGDGILQKMVHAVLARSNFVADFYFARPEEGGSGKTLVQLK